MAKSVRESVSYYPGCSGHGTGVEYDISARSVCEVLGIDLQEINDWNCCGATSAHATDPNLAIALCARNLALAEEVGLDRLVTPCAACFSRLRHAAVHIGKHGTPMGMPEVKGRSEVVHLLDLLHVVHVVHLLDVVHVLNVVLDVVHLLNFVLHHQIQINKINGNNEVNNKFIFT